MVDSDGFRPNVGIVLANARGEVLWARRVGSLEAWQFPQGGIHDGETPKQALFRELRVEVGLGPESVEIVARTRGWLRYRLPRRMRRNGATNHFKGQKQKWFLLRMLAEDGEIRVDRDAKPEFDGWRWVSYWYPVSQVIEFKREVYRRALTELAPHVEPER
jgi:putative (di)nucleoside polyphosphate hydrolase